MRGSIRAITGSLTIGARGGRSAPGITLRRWRASSSATTCELLRELPDGCVQMAYADPPFNTGKDADAPHARHRRGRDRRPHRLRRAPLRLHAAARPPPTATPSTTTSASSSRACASSGASCDPTGTLYLHLDYREAHAVKLLLDELFGRECFLNELIWAYDYGAKPKRRWPQKHDTILVYVKDPSATSSTPRRSSASPTWRPGSSRRRRRARGKMPTSASSGTRSSPPPGARRPAIRRRSRRGSCGASCRPPRAPGDLVLDPFAGSGTLGAVAAATGRRYLLMDASEDAVRVMRARLGA